MVRSLIGEAALHPDPRSMQTVNRMVTVVTPIGPSNLHRVPASWIQRHRTIVEEDIRGYLRRAGRHSQAAIGVSDRWTYEIDGKCLGRFHRCPLYLGPV